MSTPIRVDFTKSIGPVKPVNGVDLPPDLVIRLETPADHAAVERLVRDSFWDVYRPGCTEPYVLHCLRLDPGFIPELDFVMEKNGRLIGQCVYMHAAIAVDGGASLPILTMGPIAIAPDFKRQGYGRILLNHSLEKAAELGAGAVCFAGNIAFYGTCGFDYASKFGLRYHGMPEGEDAPFFLCRELRPGYLDGVSGEFTEPDAYFVEEKDAAAFDAQFPPRQKHILPGQIFSDPNFSEPSA